MSNEAPKQQQHLRRPVSSKFYEEDPAKVIEVVSNLVPREDGGDPVALFERHEAHPGGEAFIAGPRPVSVALTARVIEALREGRIIEASKQDRADYEAEQAERVTRSAEAFKERARAEYVNLAGSDEGFESMWETHLRPKMIADALHSKLTAAR